MTDTSKPDDISLVRFLGHPDAADDLLDRVDLDVGDQEIPNTDSILAANPLRLIDREIEKQRLGELFSVIYIDTLPIHETPDADPRGSFMRRVWIDGSGGEPDGVIGDQKAMFRKELAGKILRIWEEVTHRLQLSKCAPGVHPTFVGGEQRDAKRQGWPRVIFSVHSNQPPGREASLEVAVALVRQQYEAESTWPSEVSEEIDRVPAWFYSSSKSWALRVLNYDQSVGAFQKRLGRLRESLEGCGIEEPPDLGLLDLKACQIVMYEAVSERFKTVVQELKEQRTTFPDEWSTAGILASVPLGMLYRESPFPEGGFPSHFKGGLWAWFVPKGSDVKPEHERKAKELLRVMWLLLTASYSARSEEVHAEKARMMEQETTFEATAHEVKRVVGSIRKGVDPYVLESIRLYFDTLFGVAGWSFDHEDHSGLLTPEFLESKTLKSLIESSARFAMRIHRVALMCVRDKFPDNPQGAVEELIKTDLGNLDLSEVPESPVSLESEGAKRAVWLFYNAIGAALRNAFQHNDEVLDKSVRFSLLGGLLRIDNFGIGSVGQRPKVNLGGSEKTIRHYVGLYGGDAKKVSIEKVAGSERPTSVPGHEVVKWRTLIPLPAFSQRAHATTRDAR
jgi:hypothetical protein